MKVIDSFKKTGTIEIDKNGGEVFYTSALELKQTVCSNTEIALIESGKKITGGRFLIEKSGCPGEIVFVIDKHGNGSIKTNDTRHLFAFIHYLLKYLLKEEVDCFSEQKKFPVSYEWHRLCYDFYLNQGGRIHRNFDREAHVRNLAKLGFTHLEVNGLAYPMGLESGPKGETYPMFYTYCPALDQFVYSELNIGIYPFYYLSANMDYLKKNADLARKYGMTPGLLCFEPRAVPEEFFARYPMLRGARVDHPFRSFKPRYTMTLTHPLVQEHYSEMMTKLMREVSEMGFVNIWTNDSGAGFEHTQSLYVGRNGGPYMIREWKNEKEIAKEAGACVLNFFNLLLDAGRKVNPDFRVITRMESFYGEHEVIWDGLKDGVEIETASLIARGWDMPYKHPKYSDSHNVNGGSMQQVDFSEDEKPLLKDLNSRNSSAHFYFSAGANVMFAPLAGIPYPELTLKKLKQLKKNGIKNLSHLGGSFPPYIVPFNANHQIMKIFQFDPNIQNETALNKIALDWAGKNLAGVLLKAWSLVEEAILAYPNTIPLYSTIGFAWYRLWSRPFVPDMEKIPQSDRIYYEDNMCTTPHNPNNVDLSRDVLFSLTNASDCARDLERYNEHVWDPLNTAILSLKEVLKKAEKELGVGNVVMDHYIRIRALRCWLLTQRNVAAWIVGVYGYISAKDEMEKKNSRKLLDEMIDSEIANGEDLLELLESDVEFMALTDRGETPLIYGENINETVQKKIKLMQCHRNDEPYIDPDYIMKKAGEILG